MTLNANLDSLTFFAVSLAAIGMLLGSLIAGPFANLIGRQWASIIGEIFLLNPAGVECGFDVLGWVHNTECWGEINSK